MCAGHLSLVRWSGYPLPKAQSTSRLHPGACPQLPHSRDLLSQGVSQAKPSCPGLAWLASLKTASPGPRLLCALPGGERRSCALGALATNPFGVPPCQAVPQLPGLLSPELRAGAFRVWAAGT